MSCSATGCSKKPSPCERRPRLLEAHSPLPRTHRGVHSGGTREFLLATPNPSVIYAKAFSDLQLQFAHKVAILSGLPLARVLLDYTNPYILFGLGRGFDPSHPTWREYQAGLQDTN